MSRYKPYPKYKPSGVEWLGDIPEHWEVKRLKFLARINPTKSEVAHLPPDFQVQFLPMESVGEDGSYSLDSVRNLADVYGGYTYCRNNDVILAKITPCFENGKGALLGGLTNGIAFASTEFHVLRPESSLPRFVWYVTKCIPFRQLGKLEMKGAVGQQRVPDSFVANFHVAAPSKNQQSAIAVFLDRETG
ncbi:restriction endonuclease subunit S, partial [Candidatus Parcubacteria bacterium]